MTREELKGKQTPGKWVVIGTEIVNEANTSTVCATFGGHGGQGRSANIALIAEAGTVANETGMWPQDMVKRVNELEQREKELEEALEYTCNLLDRLPRLSDADRIDSPGEAASALRSARAILNKKPA